MREWERMGKGRCWAGEGLGGGVWAGMGKGYLGSRGPLRVVHRGYEQGILRQMAREFSASDM